MTYLNLKALIREIQDFPQPGISFKDISTVIGNAEAFHYIVQELAKGFRSARPEVVVGIESRGYIIGAPLAYALDAGFILVRRAGEAAGGHRTDRLFLGIRRKLPRDP